MATREQIAEEAHNLWQQAGKPEGRDDEFWFQAEKNLNQKKIPSYLHKYWVEDELKDWEIDL